MKTSFFMLGCFYLVICSYVQAMDYGKCGSGKQILNIRKLSISPYPIRLREKDAQVSVDVQLYEDIPAGARIHIKAWKITKLFAWDISLPSPCFLSIGW
ncbi:hypothetical protein AVEN_182944-1 [Araneus ventricosus]|uniref:MD-2-related lipid-recognition domain-containing protein n=1 Tax=Araneus ventricosus TaxID=182803 RepID=A0A4Y2FRB7_ARAVE|nr:hypothetical protein AVEN_182944-1 [Araneus ventricosus]